MTLTVTWQQALAWRMRRHFLEAIGKPSVAEVVRRMCGVQAQVASSAELAVGVRRDGPQTGAVARALDDGEIVKTWAMHGALHLLDAEEGGAFLSLMAAARPWERPSWERYFGMTPPLWEVMRETVREALDGEVLPREELVAAIVAQPKLAHLDDALRSGWGTILKPLSWQGELCFGPSRGGRTTFMRPDDASPGWSGLPDPEDALPVAVAAYWGAFGPVSVEAFGSWLAGGWFGTRKLRASVGALGDRLAEVDAEGDRVYVLAEHADELAATRPTSLVRLLAGFDQYVLGPGTADARVVPPARRSAVSRQSGWISPVVLAGGVVSGTWELDGDQVRVAWFKEAGRVPRKALHDEVARIADIVERDLRPSVNVT